MSKDAKHEGSEKRHSFPSSNEGAVLDGGEDGEEDQKLKRDLKPRHVDMMALTASIGTGLVIGTADSLTRGGPGGMLLAFILMGLVIVFTMTALGEMATFLPMQKGFAGYATRFVDPALGFATGWNYFCKYVVLLPTNLTAAGLLIQYWAPNLNVAIFVTVFGVILFAVNLLHVRVYGEMQFIAGTFKIVVMMGMIITCLTISLMINPKSDTRTGFHYWNNPGAFLEYRTTGGTGRLLGFWACMVQAAFAYTGNEVVGQSFGEMKNPRKNVPRAVRTTIFRIGIFYICGVITIGMSVNPLDPRLGGIGKFTILKSPFVIAITEAGIKVLPDLINASLLVFVLSAANADIYTASRVLKGLADDNQAPSIFQRINHRRFMKGNPYPAVIFSTLFLALGYMNATASATQVFQYLVKVSTVFGALNWLNILIAYLGFRKGLLAQGISLDELPYVGALQPFGSYYAAGLTVVLLIFNGYDAFVTKFDFANFITAYIGILIYFGNIAGWKLYKKCERVKPLEMDLLTNRWEFVD